jgi:hypothetical protein
LKTTARYLDVRPEPNAGGVAIRAGDLLTVNGDYIYFWCEIPAASVAQTLDVSCVELP